VVQEHQQKIKLVLRVVRRVVLVSMAMTVQVVLWASIEREMTLLLRPAVIVTKVITKIKRPRHLVCLAFQASTRTKQEMKVVSNVQVVVNSILALMLVFLLQIV
tara:strand:+ start:426 stop:737 length:312 start_codon:yes stop_codon:yes gene_type:complete